MTQKPNLTLQKIIEKFVKLSLHSSYTVHNYYHAYGLKFSNFSLQKLTSTMGKPRDWQN